MLPFIKACCCCRRLLFCKYCGDCIPGSIMHYYTALLVCLNYVIIIRSSPLPANHTTAPSLNKHGGLLNLNNALGEQIKSTDSGKKSLQKQAAEKGDKNLQTEYYGSVDYDTMDIPDPKKVSEGNNFADSILANFPVDESVDYESMEGPKPKKMIEDADNTTFPDNELTFRQMHERAQYMRIAEIKESIFSKLRLLAPPNMTALQISRKLSQFPQHLLPNIDNDNNMQNDDTASDHGDDFHAKISTVLQFTDEFPAAKNPEQFPVENIAYFSIPLSVSERNLQKAILLVYVKTPPGKEGKVVKLTISPTLYKNKPLAVRNVKLSPKGHWEHIDISEQVKEWVSDEENNYGLIAYAELDNINLVQLGDAAAKTADEEVEYIEDIQKRPHRAPLIKMTLNENEGRYKRSTFDEVPLSCEVEDREKRCCRYKFVIDFEQMGPDFEFIIQPKRYLANYCAGSCPTYYLPSNANGQLLMGLSRQKHQRCCTPKTVKPLEIIYVDEYGRVVTGLIPEMTIEKCDCS